MNAPACITTTNASRWHEAPSIRAIVVQAERRYFHRAMTSRVIGNVESWFSATTKGRAVIAALQAAHKAAVTREMGYDWQQLDHNAPNAVELMKDWIARFEAVPSPSEVLEAEFARRECREPRSERPMDAEQMAAFTAAVSAGLAA